MPPGRQRKRPPLRRGGPSAWTLLMFFMVSIVVAAAAFPTFLLLVVGLMPAAVASLIDRSRERDLSGCILAANLSGLAPSLIKLWWNGNGLDQALALLSDVFVWLMAIGSAALGWVLVFMIPPLIEVLLVAVTNQKLRRLRARQKRLIEEWGEEIAHPGGLRESEKAPQKAPVA